MALAGTLPLLSDAETTGTSIEGQVGQRRVGHRQHRAAHRAAGRGDVARAGGRGRVQARAVDRPTPVTDQVTPLNGYALPYWSSPAAANCAVLPCTTRVKPGVTLMALSTGAAPTRKAVGLRQAAAGRRHGDRIGVGGRGEQPGRVDGPAAADRPGRARQRVSRAVLVVAGQRELHGLSRLDRLGRVGRGQRQAGERLVQMRIDQRLRGHGKSAHGAAVPVDGDVLLRAARVVGEHAVFAGGSRCSKRCSTARTWWP